MSRWTRPLRRFLLTLISFPVLSRAYGRLVRIRRPRFLVRRWIRLFARHYRVSLPDFQGSPDDYPSLADYFVRPLDPARRPLQPISGQLLSPCDGRLSVLETVRADAATQVKGRCYPLSGLVARPLDFSQAWTVATIYLSPRDYHRFHYPAAGRVVALYHSPGRLFPVNAGSVESVPDLYLRNERIVLEMDIGGLPLYAVAVGATFVGSIRVECRPGSRPAPEWRPLRETVAALQEMGRFEMGGSTVILVFPAALGEYCGPAAGSPLSVGQPLVRLPGLRNG